MLNWFNNKEIEAKARPLARALKSQYGPQAASVCQAALVQQALTGERRRIVRMAMHLLDGTMAQAADNRRAGAMRIMAAELDIARG